MPKGPIPIEEVGPVVSSGREVEFEDDMGNPIPEKKSKQTMKLPEDALEGMEEKLKYVPDELKERVAQLTRDDIALPGMPRDKDAYLAYLDAEKIVRDKKRQEIKREHNFDTVKTLD